jgi:hypothetical protein
MVGNRSGRREIHSSSSRHSKGLKHVIDEDCVFEDNKTSWRLNGKHDLDVSPSKSSRTSTLSYASTLINSTESLSSSSSSESARNRQYQSHRLQFELAPSSTLSHTRATRQEGSRNGPRDTRNLGHNRPPQLDLEESTHISPTSAAHGLSPVSLTEESVLTWSESGLAQPYESIIDSKPSQLSTDDDNDTIQIMMNSTTQFQLVGKQHQKQQHHHAHRRSKSYSDATLFPTMFASSQNPFVERYTPVTLSNVGQSMNRFQESSTTGGGNGHDAHKTFRKSPSVEKSSSEYMLKSLSPARNRTTRFLGTPPNKSFASHFLVRIALFSYSLYGRFCLIHTFFSTTFLLFNVSPSLYCMIVKNHELFFHQSFVHR